MDSLDYFSESDRQVPAADNHGRDEERDRQERQKFAHAQSALLPSFVQALKAGVLKVRAYPAYLGGQGHLRVSPSIPS